MSREQYAKLYLVSVSLVLSHSSVKCHALCKTLYEIIIVIVKH